MKELKIPALIENLGTVLNFITTEFKNQPPKTIRQIEVVAEEIFVNIASYAYGAGQGNAVIRICIDDENQFTIEFEDYGEPYNPLEKDDPDITLGANERKIGGLGVFMVKNIMDSVDYRRDGNKNLLIVKKQI